MDRKLVEQLRATVSVSKRKMLDAAADAIERLCLKCVDAAMLLDEIEAEAQTAIKYEQRVHMDWVADRIGEWKREQTDTELTDRIDRLRELVHAEQEGCLLMLPCKVGDTLYYAPEWYARCDYGPEPISVEEVNSYSGTIVVECYLDPDTRVSVNTWDFGKTVFLTREEAEQALKGGAE